MAGRRSNVAVHTDVVVVGGGTGGVTAAMAAAELGARVTLVERDSGLGGVGTRAGVHYYYWGQRGGLQDLLDKEVRGAAAPSWGKYRGFHPMAKQITVERRLSELGVEILTNATVSAVSIDEGRVTGVTIDHPEGSVTLSTRVLVDATANGDVAALCGAAFHVGRAWDQAMNTYSHVPRYIDSDDQLNFANYDCGWLDSTDPDDISDALAIGRATGYGYFRDSRDHQLLTLGPQLGVREGRRVVGDTTMTQAEVFDQAERPDVVFRCRTHHDTHARDYANESDLAQLWVPVLGWRRRGFRGDVSYGTLLPRGIDGLIIGSRAFSCDQDIAAGVRMQRDMHRLGEVAGVAAGLAVRLGVTPRQVPIHRLQEDLRERGVLTPLPDTSASDGPRSVAEALPLLGTEHETDAWWWFHRNSPEGRDELLAMLSGSDEGKRRSAAFALSLAGDTAGHDVLRRVIRAGDDDAPGDPLLDLAAPRWLAALILLRMAGDTAVAPTVIERLATPQPSATVLYLLHYLHDVAPSLDRELREQALAAIDAALAVPDLGEDYLVQNSERRSGLPLTRSSIRWNIELTASATIEALGGDGSALRDAWRNHNRGAARRFVRHLEADGAPGAPETQARQADRVTDIIVAGGGVAGVAAALRAAAEPGVKVTLVEPGPVLGHEVSAARRSSLGGREPADPLLHELRRHGCVTAGHLDPVATSVALDAICAEAGVSVLLHAVPGDVLTHDGAVTGLSVTTAAGPLVIRARAVIDATPSGRVLGRWATRTARDPLTGISLLLRGTELEHAELWRPQDSPPATVIRLDPLPTPGWARFTLVAPVTAVQPEGILSAALEYFDQARATLPALRRARLSLAADAPLEPPAGRRRLLTVADVPAGLAAAGASLPEAPGVSADDRDVWDHSVSSGFQAAEALIPLVGTLVAAQTEKP